MTLPASGQISFSQINTELGRSAGTTISIESAENGVYATINTLSPSYPSSTNPASISEWYSYNHNYTTTTTTTTAADVIVIFAPGNPYDAFQTYYFYATMNGNFYGSGYTWGLGGNLAGDGAYTDGSTSFECYVTMGDASTGNVNCARGTGYSYVDITVI